jgi:hypothetical protein
MMGFKMVSKKSNDSIQEKRPSFLIYKSFYYPIEDLNDEEMGKLFRAIFKFQIDAENMPLPEKLKMAFDFFKNQFLVDQSKYLNVCHKNSENANSRWKNAKNAKASDQMRPHNSHAKNTDIDKEKEADTYKDKETKNSRSVSIDDFHLATARRIANHIKLKKQLSITEGQIKIWAKDIALLEKKELKTRNSAFNDIEKAVKAIEQYDGEAFFPSISSGKTFREKFAKIEDFISRAANNQTKPDKFTKNVSASLVAINNAMKARGQNGV